VRLTVGGVDLETGHQFMGSLIGDHAKTAIGTMLGTGSVIGAGANVFDDLRAPKYVPPFAWGGSASERMTQQKFLDIIERVLPRRDVPVTDPMRKYLRRSYEWLNR
jgi:lysozyme family protein